MCRWSGNGVNDVIFDVYVIIIIFDLCLKPALTRWCWCVKAELVSETLRSVLWRKTLKAKVL